MTNTTTTVQLLLFIVSLFVPSTTARRLNSLRIINGQDADPNKHAYFAVSGGGSFFLAAEARCGASLIHPDILLTAAHCQGAFNYETFLLNPSSQKWNREVQIDAQRPHPDFFQNTSLLNYDILLLRLSEPIYDLPPIALNFNESIPSEGQTVTAVGFGRTDTEEEASRSQTLQQAQFLAISNETCQERASNYGIRGVDFTLEGVLCVDPNPSTGSSVCKGDSGGSLIVETNDTTDGQPSQQALVGVTSFSINCQDDDLPDGFARVSTFAPWIQQQICEISRVPPEDCPSPTPVPARAVRLRLEIQFDWNAHEIALAIRNRHTGSIEYAGPQFVPSQSSKGTSYLNLLPGYYTLELYDNYKGDGLQCPDPTGLSCIFLPEGGWGLYAYYEDGSDEEVLLASGGADFGSKQLTDFVVEGPPTVAPSMTPSMAPIETNNDATDSSSSSSWSVIAKTGKESSNPEQTNGSFP